MKYGSRSRMGRKLVRVGCGVAAAAVILGGALSTSALTPSYAGMSRAFEGCRYYLNLNCLELTGDARTDIVMIAMSQLGYHEGNSPEDYAGNNQSGSKDYTEYGRYLNSIGRAWCSEFASWCIRKAGVPLKLVSNSRSATVYNFTKNSSGFLIS